MYTSTQQRQAGYALRSGRTWIIAVAALLAISGVLFVWLVTGQQSGSETSQAPSTSVSLQSGPNETLRGIAASAAAGGVLVTPGGPSESARGAAAHSAATPSVIPSGGPSEAARGAAAHSATAPSVNSSGGAGVSGQSPIYSRLR
ncbi:MAG TPA: hypothetical protein VGN78_00805 [Solirubrobacteraceae bacterium]|jgi:hypothetical protein|nr:hypothetical protein [Solirubrobacteraceae bacterium]